MVRALFIAGHDQVILDATNTTKKRRDEWKSKDWLRDFYNVDTDFETCLKRADESGFPIDVLERMHKQLEDVLFSEFTDQGDFRV